MNGHVLLCNAITLAHIKVSDIYHIANIYSMLALMVSHVTKLSVATNFAGMPVATFQVSEWSEVICTIYYDNQYINISIILVSCALLLI